MKLALEQQEMSMINPAALFLIPFAAALFSFIELIGTLRFKKIFYRLGPVIYRSRSDDLNGPLPPQSDPVTLTAKEARFRFDSADECLFVPNIGFWSRCTIKGVVTWSGDHADVVVRHSLGPVIFLGSLTGLIAYASWEAKQPIILIVVALVAGYVLISKLFFETRRIEQMLRELKRLLMKRSACSNK